MNFSPRLGYVVHKKKKGLSRIVVLVKREWSEVAWTKLHLRSKACEFSPSITVNVNL